MGQKSAGAEGSRTGEGEVEGRCNGCWLELLKGSCAQLQCVYVCVVVEREREREVSS